MIKKEHKINPIPNYIDITKVDITKWYNIYRTYHK